ncbi:hypothetical protein OSB04_016323 [Centaurea solstitialis]|uniref:DUF4283 domain-containing protein n=1 Tax=Centaurea solstitialis TaxID=347529 RepID=A0AA38TKR4_9ASTR|nr:hypothetical protein OSB04_016323 [Centaurea solstitialis]
MEANRPPDPTNTRNRACKENKGSASLTLSAPFPATTAGVPACGGTHGDRRPEDHVVVVSDCSTNTTTAAASYFSSEWPSSPHSASSPPHSIASPVTSAAVASPPVIPPSPTVVTGGGGVSHQPLMAGFASTEMAQSPPATAGLTPPAAATSMVVSLVITPPEVPEWMRGWKRGEQERVMAKTFGSPLYGSTFATTTTTSSPTIVGYTSTKSSEEGGNSKPHVTPNPDKSTGFFFDITKPPNPSSTPKFSFPPKDDNRGNTTMGRGVDDVKAKDDVVGTNVDVKPNIVVQNPILHDTMQVPTRDMHGVDGNSLPNAGNFVDENDRVHVHVEANEKIDHKPVSFADLLNKGKLTYYPPVVSELGTRRAIIPDELVHRQASEWALTLAGYFIGKRPAFPFVQFHARRIWKQYGLSEVILNDQGHFFFKFNSEQGLNFVFENGPWLFNGMPIFIQKWHLGLCFEKPEPKNVPLWVNIYGLPLDVWDFEIISYIASVVGEPIYVDRYTEEMCETKSGRANFARILVNASADYDLPKEIDAIILGKLRKFRTEFLWKPKRCSHCKLFGHDLVSCLACPQSVVGMKTVKHVPSVTCIGESSKAKAVDDGFKFPKRNNKPKPKIGPLKVGGQKPKVAFTTGIKINQRYVPKPATPSIDPLDKGKAKLDDVDTSSKPHTERIPIKVSNQFSVLEEDPSWIADKKEVDEFVEKKRGGT